MLRLGAIAFALGLSGLFAWLYLGLYLPQHPQDRPLDLPDRPVPLRVTLFGTSLTATYDWPATLQDCAGGALDVSRVALAGAGSDWAVTQTDRVLAQNPDLVVIEFSVNDADLRQRTSLRQSLASHAFIISELRAGNPGLSIVLMTMNPAHGVRRVMRPRLGGYYRLYRDLAEEMQTGLLDLYPRWLAHEGWKRQLPDGLHPDPVAATGLIVPALADYLGLSCRP